MPHSGGANARHRKTCVSRALAVVRLAMLALVGGGLPVAHGDEPAELAALDGRRWGAQVVELSPEGDLVFQAGASPGRLAAGQWLRWGNARPIDQGPVAVLVDGGFLVGDIVSLDAEQLVIRSRVAGSLTVPRGMLAGLVWQLPSDTAQRDLAFDHLTGAPADEDLLVLDNGDHLRGRLVTIGERGLQFELGGNPVELGSEAVSRLTCRGESRQLADPPTTWVALADGSIVAVVAAKRDAAHWELVPRVGTRWVLPVRPQDPVCGLWRLAGPFRYLSDLVPAGYRQVPFLEVEWPYRLDRSVGGSRLRAGGQFYPKGIGLHSASRITWRLEGGYRRFVARLAVDDEVGMGGSLVGRVFLDSEVTYTSPALSAGQPPVDVTVDLGSARSLSLVVDYALGIDSQDHADWLEARLEE